MPYSDAVKARYQVRSSQPSRPHITPASTTNLVLGQQSYFQHPQQAPSQRSLPVRASIWLLGALTFTTLGIYIGLNTLLQANNLTSSNPNNPLLNAPSLCASPCSSSAP